MPKGDWGHGGHKGQTFRACHREFDKLEQTPDLSRGDIRLAAEVVLTRINGHEVPDFAHERALDALAVMARG